LKSYREFSLSRLSALHVMTLFTFGVAHPLYEVLGHEDHAPFFVAHQSRAIDIWLFVLFLSFLLPFALFLVLWLLNLLSTRLARGLYALLLAVLFSAFFLPISDKLLPGMENSGIALGLLAAAIATSLYLATSWARTYVTVMSLVIVLSPLLFVTGASMKPFLATSEVRDYEITPGARKVSNVVMILLDELPLNSLLDENREIDEVRYPNFHRLAKTATWYRNTTCTHYSTSGALPSLLVGGDFDSYLRKVRRGSSAPSGKLDRENVPGNLFSLLEDHYQVFAIEAVSQLARENQAASRSVPPLSRRFVDLAVDASIVYGHLVAPPQLRKSLPVTEGQWRDFLGAPSDLASEDSPWPYEGKALGVRQFLDLLEKRNEPSFYFLHLLLPHFPFTFNEQGQTHPNKFRFMTMHLREATGSNRWPDETIADLAYQAHLLQLGFTDLLLGLILDRLVELDLFEDSLLVVAADHGISFYWDSAGLSAGELAEIQASETLQVPLMIKLPGQSRAELSDKPLQTIDIVPTLADLVGVEASWEIEGVSALDETPREVRRSAYLPTKMHFGAAIDPEYRSLKRKVELFGTRSLERIYLLGPHREIVNAPVEAFASSTSTATVALKAPDRYRRLDPMGPRLPAYVEGEIGNLAEGMRTSGLTIAVAINGVIRNTTRTTRVAVSSLTPENAEITEGDDGVHFLLRAPPESFVEGKNAVTVHAVVDDEHGGPASLLNFAEK
jgi:hypothetical protein